MPTENHKKTDPEFLRRNAISVFFTLAFLISWGGVLAITLPTGIPGSGEALDRLYALVFLPMLAGPFLSALILSLLLDGPAGLKRLLLGFTVWRAKPLEYAAVFFMIPACALTVLSLFSAVEPAYTPAFLSTEGGIVMIASGLAIGITAGVIEETGWTGFVTARRQKDQTGLGFAVGLGIIHGFWHLLITIWYAGDEYGFVLIPYFLTAWILAIIVMRILVVWIFVRTGSTLLAAAAHTSHSGWFFVFWPPTTSPVQDVIWTAAFGTLGLVVILAIVYFAPLGDQKDSTEHQ